MIFCFPFLPVPGRNFIPLVLFDIRVDHGHKEAANTQGNQTVQTIQNQFQNIFHYCSSLVQEIIIVRRSKVVFCPGFSAQRFPITNLLQVVQAAGRKSLNAADGCLLKADSRSQPQSLSFATCHPRPATRADCWRLTASLTAASKLSAALKLQK